MAEKGWWREGSNISEYTRNASLRVWDFLSAIKLSKRKKTGLEELQTPNGQGERSLHHQCVPSHTRQDVRASTGRVEWTRSFLRMRPVLPAQEAWKQLVKFFLGCLTLCLSS